MLFEYEIVGAGNALKRARAMDGQKERIVKAAGALQHRSTAGAASENRDRLLLAKGEVDFGGDRVRIAKHYEVLRRLPKPQHSVRVSSFITFFTKVEQRFVAREIFFGRTQGQLTMLHAFTIVSTGLGGCVILVGAQVPGSFASCYTILVGRGRPFLSNAARFLQNP